jgi:hypothetical protein
MTHMARRQGVTENLMALEVDFIKHALGMAAPA